MPVERDGSAHQGSAASVRDGGSADLFLSFTGRLDRERWLGAVALFVAVVVATQLLTWQLTRQGAIEPGTRDAWRFGVQAFLLVPWLALDWKRFHDLGWAGPLALLCPGLIVLDRMIDWPAVSALVPARDGAREVLAWTQLVLAAWLAYALATKRGTDGPNRHGPDPRESRPGLVAAAKDPA